MKIPQKIRDILLAAIGGAIGAIWSFNRGESGIVIGLLTYAFLRTIFTLNRIETMLQHSRQSTTEEEG